MCGLFRESIARAPASEGADRRLRLTLLPTANLGFWSFQRHRTAHHQHVQHFEVTILFGRRKSARQGAHSTANHADLELTHPPPFPLSMPLSTYLNSVNPSISGRCCCTSPTTLSAPCVTRCSTRVRAFAIDRHVRGGPSTVFHMMRITALYLSQMVDEQTEAAEYRVLMPPTRERTVRHVLWRLCCASCFESYKRHWSQLRAFRRGEDTMPSGDHTL